MAVPRNRCLAVAAVLLSVTLASVSAVAGSLTAALISLDHQNFPFVYLSVVAEQAGAGISTLGQGNFQVTENGNLQTDYFEVTPPEIGGGVRTADIVFLMDNSGSMSGERDTVRDNVRAFVDQLEAAGVDYQLGLCRFGATEGGGQPIIEDGGTLTSDPEYFKNDVWGRNVINGGHEPGWDALHEASNGFAFRPGAQKVFILITDECVTHPGDTNHGTFSYDDARNALLNRAVTLFALIDLAYENSIDDYGTIAEATNGQSFDIYSAFGDILAHITSQVANTYRITYRSSEPAFNGVERHVVVQVDHQGDQATCEGWYTPGSAPRIARTQDTLDLHKQPWAAGTALAIRAEITDSTAPFVQNATLYYRRTGDANYASTAMAHSSDVWSGTIPGAAVDPPGVDYYIAATDGQSTATSPSVDPRTRPHQLAILPNVAPQITHTPVTTVAEHTRVTISAQIADTTNALDSARLWYRRVGQLVYRTNGEMRPTGGGGYEDTIPISFITTAGIEYYIHAVDDLGVGNSHGTFDDPHEITVAGNEAPNAKIESSDVDEASGSAAFTWSGTDDETPAGSLEFCYRLLGSSDPGWSTWASGTSRTYTGLLTGSYTFQVRAKDSDGAIDPSPASHAFAITGSVPRFLTLPFTDPTVKIQQGWRYTSPIGSNPNDPYVHNGIDYIRGDIDQPPWDAFDVVAAADGSAMQSSGGGYGTFVLVRHVETDPGGQHYFTLYSHLASVVPGIPSRSRWDTDYQTWKGVSRGEKLGSAGATGSRDTTWVHLHFEVQRGAYGQGKTDPYDIQSTRENYPGGSSYDGCGPSHLWASEPVLEPNPAGSHPDTHITATSITGGCVEIRWEGDDDLTAASDLVFSYRLLGLDGGQWTDWAAASHVEFVELPDGEYTFEVRAQDAHGLADPVPASWEFAIVIPEWRSDLQIGDILYAPRSLAGLGHIGIYVGCGLTVDPGLADCVSSIDAWDAYEEAIILRVDCPIEDRTGAASIAWSIAQHLNYSYDPLWVQKDPDPEQTAWYCSELVWAAYWNRGINIEANPDNSDEAHFIGDPVSPHEICVDSDVRVVGGHCEGVAGCWAPGASCPIRGLNAFVTLFCPADLVLTDPDGAVVSRSLCTLLGAVYFEDDVNGDGSVDKLIILPSWKSGEYRIAVVPEPDAAHDATYRLVVRDPRDGSELVLADGVLLESAPSEGYRVILGADTLYAVDINPVELGAGAVRVGPNPVPSAGTAFFYSLPEGAEAAKLMIFCVTGRKVLEIPLDVDSSRFPSTGKWDPVDQYGIPLANGPYVYVLIADGRVAGQGKMVIQR